MDLLFVFCIGFVASVLSGIAGGGGGLITSPFFVLFGLPPQVAVATAKFGGVGVTLGALLKLRGTGNVRYEYVIPLIILVVICSLVGTRLLISLDNETVTRVIGGLLLFSVPFLFLKKETGLVRIKTSKLAHVIGYVLYAPVVILQAAFGSGIGSLLPLIMTQLWGFTFLESAATRRVPGIVASFTSLFAYAAYGVVNYQYGVVILCGSFCGSWVGTHIALRQGNVFVKYVLCALLLVGGTKFLFF